MGVKLLGTKTSVPCSRVEWALKLKGIEYEYLEENLKNKSFLLLELNPVYEKVPVLVHDGKPLSESLVILEYIDGTWVHNPLMPQDPYERATVRFLADNTDQKCISSLIEACKVEGNAKKAAIENAFEQLVFLEKHIEGKKFFGGNRIGYLDLAVGWISFWLGVIEEVGEMMLLDEQRLPCLYRWSQNFIETPIIKESLPPREVLVEYSQALINHYRSLPT